jgi:ribonuclease III
LSHRSYASESRSGIYNERLEFLGDSILAAIVAHQLFLNHPREDEGALSKRKSLLVSRPALAQRASDLNLGAYLYLGVGEETSGGRGRQSLLANALEALIGAIYLDGGYPAAARFVRTHCMGTAEGPPTVDFKSRLQEVLQKRYKSPPTYELARTEGPDHDRTFEAVVRLGKKSLGRGQGKSKKEAEQSAASDALERLK